MEPTSTPTGGLLTTPTKKKKKAMTNSRPTPTSANYEASIAQLQAALLARNTHIHQLQDRLATQNRTFEMFERCGYLPRNLEFMDQNALRALANRMIHAGLVDPRIPVPLPPFLHHCHIPPHLTCKKSMIGTQGPGS